MSYKTLTEILTTATEDSLINTIVIDGEFTDISDDNKKAYPLLHCQITGGTPSFSPNETMFNSWTVNSFLYLGDGNSASKSTLSNADLIESNIYMEQIIAQYIRQIYNVSDSFDSLNITTNIPIKNNGANTWNLTMGIKLMNDNTPCVDC